MNPNFALIGCGRIAERHALQMARVGNIVAVCDIIPQRAEKLAKAYNATPYTSLTEMLRNEPKIEIASVCTPNGLHAEHSILCLNAGKNVLCEKPLAISVADAREMTQASETSGRKLFVVKQNRYNAPVMAVKQLLEAGRLGRISSFQINCFWNRPAEYYRDSWRGTKKLDGGTLYTQFSHFIDLLYWLLGDVQSVNALVKNLQHPYIETEDSGIILFEMQNGAIGSMNYTVNSYEKNMEGSFSILGDKGSVKIGGQYLNTLEYQHIEGEQIICPASETGANEYGFYQGSMSNHDKVYDHLIEELQHSTSRFANAYDGLKTVEIIEKIYQQAGFQSSFQL